MTDNRKLIVLEQVVPVPYAYFKDRGYDVLLELELSEENYLSIIEILNQAKNKGVTKDVEHKTHGTRTH